MKKLSREKIALIIFALLVVCGFGALMFYITNIGHSFNVTASTIDDAAGDLGDYTAIIYEGTAEEKKALGEAGLERIAEDGSNKTLELGKDQQVDDAAAGDEVVVSDVVPKSTADGQGSAEEPKKPLTLSAVRDSFLQKNASVYVLDLSDPTRYINETIAKGRASTASAFSRSTRLRTCPTTSTSVSIPIALPMWTSSLRSVDDHFAGERCRRHRYRHLDPRRRPQSSRRFFGRCVLQRRSAQRRSGRVAHLTEQGYLR